MALKLNKAGKMIRGAVDALSNAQKRDRTALYNAIGKAVEQYCEDWAKQLKLTVPPTPGLGTSTAPGNPTAPGPAPVILGPNLFS